MTFIFTFNYQYNTYKFSQISNNIIVNILMVHTLIKLLSIKLSNINHTREKIIITINVINKLKLFHLNMISLADSEIFYFAEFLSIHFETYRQILNVYQIFQYMCYFGIVGQHHIDCHCYIHL